MLLETESVSSDRLCMQVFEFATPFTFIYLISYLNLVLRAAAAAAPAPVGHVPPRGRGGRRGLGGLC